MVSSEREKEKNIVESRFRRSMDWFPMFLCDHVKEISNPPN